MRFSKARRLGSIFLICLGMLITPLAFAQPFNYDSSWVGILSNILQKVNNLPQYLDAFLQLTVSCLKLDDSAATKNFQSNFTAYGQAMNSSAPDTKLQKLLISQTFLPADLATLKDGINNLNYLTLIGAQKSKDPQSPFNYLVHASGADITHKAPDSMAPGGKDYQTYYNDITSIQTYNAYLLSKVYAENQNGNHATAVQAQLTKLATSTDWFATVATEEMGVVARQLLMFTSQMYVLMNQSIEIQKEMLTAHAMNNTLLLLLNKANEPILLQRASMPVTK